MFAVFEWQNSISDRVFSSMFRHSRRFSRRCRLFPHAGVCTTPGSCDGGEIGLWTPRQDRKRSKRGITPEFSGIYYSSPFSRDDEIGATLLQLPQSFPVTFSSQSPLPGACPKNTINRDCSAPSQSRQASRQDSSRRSREKSGDSLERASLDVRPVAQKTVTESSGVAPVPALG